MPELDPSWRQSSSQESFSPIGEHTRLRFPAAASSARALPNPPSEKGGRRECRVHGRTHSLACEMKKHASIVTTGTPKHSGTPRANGFNGFFRALPGDRAFLSPSPEN